MLWEVCLVRSSPGGRPAPESIIDRLTPLESGINRVPVLDSSFAHAPAKQDDFFVEAKGKIEQAGVEVLHLNANGVDLGDALAHPFQVRLHLGAPVCNISQIDAHAARQIDASAELGKLGLHFFRVALALDRPLEKRLQNRE